MCELLHTSPVVQKMMGTKSKSVTVVTASEAETSHAACAVAWKHRAVAAEAGRSYLKGACPRAL
jgi:hypothetical protein